MKPVKMEFNPRYINTKSTLSEPKAVNLGSLLDMLLDGDLDFNPPYQRDQAWKPLMNEYLILSILNGRPINTIYLVSKGNSSECWVLDGKQRLTAIKAFIENQFSVTLFLVADDGVTITEHTVFYRDLKIKTHPCHFLLMKMKMFQLSVVKNDPMSFDEQGELFTIINSNEPQSDNERIYCNRFLATKVLKHLFEEFTGIQTFFQNKQVATNFRFQGIRALHNLLVLSYGYDLNDVYAHRELGMPVIKGSAQALHEKCIRYEVDARTELTLEIMQKLGLDGIAEDLSDVCSWFNEIVMSKNGFKKGKKFEKNLIVNFLAFLIRKKRERILTSSMMKDVAVTAELLRILIEYSELRKHNAANYTRSTQLSATVKTNAEALDRLFDGSTIDKGIKNKRIPSNSKVIPALTANAYCPITGKPLSDDSVQFDHLRAKAVSSDAERVSAVSRDGNLYKSDITKSVAKSINTLMT